MNLKIEYKEITKLYKLTVAKDEVRLKLPPNIDGDLSDHLIKMSSKVAEKIYANYIGTERGYWKFERGYWRISMMGNDRKKDAHFYERGLLDGI
jgi:hypothetical protein